MNIEIGGPALADVLDSQNSDWLSPFLDYVTKNDLPLDFLSWHSYANYPYTGPFNPGGQPLCFGRASGPGTNLCYYNPNLDPLTVVHELGQARAELARYPILHPLFIVDEWNLDGEYDPREAQTFDAAYTAAVLNSAQAERLDGMCFFTVEDSASNSAEDWGMLTSDGKPKPVYDTFSYWHDLAPREIPVMVASHPARSKHGGVEGADQGTVGAVASTAGDGTVTVLLDNFKPYDKAGNYGTHDPTPYDRMVVLDVAGLRGGSYSVSRKQVDGSHDGGLVWQAVEYAAGGSIRIDFTLSGEGVAFVTLHPEG